MLEPLTRAHADEMVTMLADEALHVYTGGRPLTLAELRARYELQERGTSRDGRQRWLNWIVRERSSAEAVGYVQATVEDARADVAWVIGSRFQRRGFGREAAAAMVDRLRALGVTTVSAHIHPANVASQRVAQALGLAVTETVSDGEVVWVS